MTEFSGSCLCGRIRYTVGRAPVQVVACHCTLCRRMTGAPFSVYVVARSVDLRLQDGDQVLMYYPVTERTTRSFCGACGSPIFNANPSTYPGFSMLYLGTTEVAMRFIPAMEIYCESRLPWVALGSGSKVYARSPGEA